MLHSVIIPHRNRNADLRHCLWALGQSYKACGLGRDDVEVIVVDTRSDDVPRISGYGCHARLVFDPNTLKSVTIRHKHPSGGTSTASHEVYCKTAALNVGMDAAKGDLLTFLDADAIVGPRFLDAWKDRRALGWSCCCPPTKLAYQIRQIDDKGVGLLRTEGPESSVETRKRWGHLSTATEIYVTPGNDIAIGNIPCVPEEYDSRLVVGNSHFTIPRENLRGRRWNEDYIGAVSEDLDMLRGIFLDHGADYRAQICRHPDYAILGIPTVDNGQPDWRPPELGEMNRRRYFGE